MVFDDVTLVLPDGLIENGRLRVSEGRIESLGPASAILLRAGERIIAGHGGYLTPGYIDLHVHGALGRDAMEAVPEAFAEILRFHATGGTTALALASVTATKNDLLRLLEAVRDWKNGVGHAHAGANCLGVHLEGPYFAPVKAGVHRPEFLRHPTAGETAEFLAYADVITQMTLAPELPGSLDLIKALRARGIIASGGHSDAWDEQAHAAHACGMTQVTHVFNAMSGARRRGAFRVAGLLEYALAEPDIRCELIADGHHVSPTLMQLAYRAKGRDGICLVTDASPGTGLSEGSRYRFADQDCVVQSGVGLTSDASALAGSVATAAQGVRNLVELVHVPLCEAVRMATLNPACALRLDQERGQLAPGLRADLTLLTRKLAVAATFVAGQAIFLADMTPAAADG